MKLCLHPSEERLQGRVFDPSRWLRAAKHFSLKQGFALDSLSGNAEGVVLLHSARTVEGLGKWSILGVCPRVRVRGTVGDAVLEVFQEGTWTQERRHEDPFSLLEALSCWRSLASPEEMASLPFVGGVMGVLGYACRSALEDLKREDSRWGEGDLWWGWFDTFLVHDHATLDTRIVSWRGPEQVQEWMLAYDEAREEAPEEAVIPEVSPGWSKEDYQKAFERVMLGIEAGEFYQGCLTYPARSSRGDLTGEALFSKLCGVSPAPFAAFLSCGEPVVLASASPERFLEVRKGRVRARPMKGTRPRGKNPQEDLRIQESLRQSTKDQAENVMIVDLMRNDLGRVCLSGSVHVPELFTVETYETVHQMTSTIEGVLRDEVGVVGLLRASFPPGSMTGAPKIQAMKLLQEVEPGPRGWYSGVVGYIDARGEADFSVVIRTAILSEYEVVWHVGGGVVADSTAEGEWQESRDKCLAPWRVSQTQHD